MGMPEYWGIDGEWFNFAVNWVIVAVAIVLSDEIVWSSGGYSE